MLWCDSAAVSANYEASQRLSPTTRKLLFGYVAGLCAETAIYPLDTVRRRQQALGDASPLGRLGQFDVLRALVHVARSEGIAGMFKGLSLNLVKNPIATAVSFTVNDVVKDFLKNKRARSAGP
jgi:solute carrier family 25 protein 42